ncbi:MAG: rod shape-determining protein MreC [Bacteroidales bacterium]
MQNLIRFLLRYYFVILFIAIETLSISLLINNNNYQNSKFVGFTRSLSGTFYGKINNIRQYLKLKEENKRLAEENVRLKNYLSSLEEPPGENKLLPENISDTVMEKQYHYNKARVINNSINKQHNYITLDKGSEDGIEPEMGVVADDGVVGIVHGVSDHFSTVISVLNNELKISAKHKNSGYFGSLTWNGEDYQYVRLQEIPLHTKLSNGDSIVTSGYSTIFPEDILIGFVDEWEEKGGSFYEINVRLSLDFKKLSHVYIIQNSFADEQKTIEEIGIK